jgi:addiction module RelB/DinJ family antitoxin
MSTVTVRIDADMKRDAEYITKSYGINLPTAFRMFAAEIVRTKSVPFSLSYQTSPDFGLTGQAYLDFLHEEKRKIEAGNLGIEHELIEV